MRRWQSVLARLSRVVETDEALVLGVLVRRLLLQFGARLGISRAEAERLFTEGRALAEGLGDVAQLAGLNQFRANFQFWNGEFGPALESFINAARVGDQADDAGLWASLWTGPTLVYPYTGPVEDGLALADRAIALSAGDPDVGVQHLGYSPLTRPLLFRAELLALAGRLEEARRDGSAAVDLARLRSETEFVVWSQAFSGRLAWYCGEEGDALARTTDAVRLAADSGNRGAHVVALLALGTAEVAARRWSDADRVLCKALEQAEAHGAHFEIARIQAYRAQARLQLGDVSAARELGDRAVALSRTQGARIIECLALLTRGEVSRVCGDGDSGAADLAGSLALAEETGAVIYEALIHEQLARLRGEGDALADAARRYQTIGATGRARALGVAPP